MIATFIIGITLGICLGVVGMALFETIMED